MTLALFGAMLAAFALISSLVTEGVKTIIGNKPKASTLIVGIVSAVVGWGGMAIAYVCLKIPFNEAINLICLFLMAPACWLTATMGYDNVMKIVVQIGKILEAKN